ncbi:integrase [Thalassotalea loyana]|uniref:Integrase n=1 Tax=Thalassotalea loyana TaxID=280483 RepID=A0ABQ6HAF5_9GAMM|nr:site-specific integrase [Thalassotalea loyana]GLX85098.1 integrase [Thalassotalea loyana]
MNITNKWLEKVFESPREKTEIFKDDKRDGLAARVSPKGKITWQYRYYYFDVVKQKSTQRRIDLGVYPEMPLAAARKERDRLAEYLDKNEDPKQVLLIEKDGIQSRQTVKQVFEQWYSSASAGKRKSNNMLMNRVNYWILPKFGKVHFDKIPVIDWINFIQDVADEKPESARSLISEIKQASKWAKKAKLIDTLPLVEYSATDFGIKRRVKDRVLADHEISLIFTAIQKSMLRPANKALFTLLFYYGCRVGELRQAEIKHFDLVKGIWTVPAEISKTGNDIKRPIIPEFVPIIKFAIDLSSSNTLLFPCSKSEEDRVVGDRSHIGIPYNLTAWIDKHRPQPEKFKHWSTHDIRRTARTNWEKLRIDDRYSEKMLGHVLQGVLKNYNHHDYLEEMADAYRQWFYKLEQIQGRASNVTPITRNKAG